MQCKWYFLVLSGMLHFLTNVFYSVFVLFINLLLYGVEIQASIKFVYVLLHSLLKADCGVVGWGTELP
jgi:hypothetical protein